MSDESQREPDAPSAPTAPAPTDAAVGAPSLPQPVSAEQPSRPVPDPPAMPRDEGGGTPADSGKSPALGTMKRGTPKRMALAFLAGVACLALAAGVQHLRHGWPFSLHHEVGRTRAASGLVGARGADALSDAAVAPPRSSVELDETRATALGIATSAAERRELRAELRTVATVVPDESRVSHVHTRVAGWVERLSVQTTGETVRSGAVLATIFSRELLASQSEFLAVLRSPLGGSSSPLARGARDRLGVLGMAPDDIAALERRGTVLRNVRILAPRGGVVLRRGVTAGAAVDPSTELFVIADLSRLWVLAEVPEARMAEVRVGSAATLELSSSGVAAVEGAVDFVYPTLSEGTRTLRVRFVIANPEGAIRPGAFGTAVFHLAPRTALVVPRDAIVDGGSEQHVFVAMGGGRFEPRTVRTGARFDDRIEVLEGLRAGERVVSTGVFLLDSESRLRASGGSGSHAGMVMPGDPPRAAERRPSPPRGPHDGMDMGGQAP